MHERSHEAIMREKPGHTILHVGTNDLNRDRPSDLIAKSIVDLAVTLRGIHKM